MTFRQDEMELTVGPWPLRTDYQPRSYPNWKTLIPSNAVDQANATNHSGESEGADRCCPPDHVAGLLSLSVHELPVGEKGHHAGHAERHRRAEETVTAEYDDQPHVLCLDPHFLLEVLETLRAEQIRWSPLSDQTPPPGEQGRYNRARRRTPRQEAGRAPSGPWASLTAGIRPSIARHRRTGPSRRDGVVVIRIVGLPMIYCLTILTVR